MNNKSIPYPKTPTKERLMEIINQMGDSLDSFNTSRLGFTIHFYQKKVVKDKGLREMFERMLFIFEQTKKKMKPEIRRYKSELKKFKKESKNE